MLKITGNVTHAVSVACFGATIGVLAAQAIVNHYCQYNTTGHLVGDWTTVWYIFAGFALIVAIAFALIFREKKNNNI